MNELGNLIKELREKKKFSQRQLALYSGISNTEISKLESGERQKPNPNILKQISPHLGVTHEYLMSVAGYTDDDCNGNMLINEIDELEKEFPEGVKILRRASKQLSSKAKKKMIKIIETFMEEED